MILLLCRDPRGGCCMFVFASLRVWVGFRSLTPWGMWLPGGARSPTPLGLTRTAPLVSPPRTWSGWRGVCPCVYMAVCDTVCPCVYMAVCDTVCPCVRVGPWVSVRVCVRTRLCVPVHACVHACVHRVRMCACLCPRLCVRIGPRWRLFRLELAIVVCCFCWVLLSLAAPSVPCTSLVNMRPPHIWAPPTAQRCVVD
jgi:hypothetical protein